MSQYSPPTYHTQTKTPSIIHRHLLQTNPKSHPATSPQYHNSQTYTHTTHTSKIEMRAPPNLTTLQTQIQNKPGNISHMYQMQKGPGDRETFSTTLSFHLSPQNLLGHHLFEGSLDETDCGGRLH